MLDLINEPFNIVELNIASTEVPDLRLTLIVLIMFHKLKIEKQILRAVNFDVIEANIANSNKNFMVT